MINETEVSQEPIHQSEQSPDDHGEIRVRQADEEELVDPRRENTRPADSESAPLEETVIVDDHRDPVSPNKR